jgi:serine/threonine protein kinase
VKESGKLPKVIADTLFSQIVDAVEFLHKETEIAHLDLKLENILLTENYNIKICDFGFCQSTGTRNFKSMGTEGYKSPEIHKLQSRYENNKDILKVGYSGVSSDLFALGVTFFIMHFGVPPFSRADVQVDRLYKIISHYSKSVDKNHIIKLFLRSHPITKPLLAENLIDFDLIDLIMNLLQEDPSDRIQDISGLKAHTYFRNK